MLVSDLVVSELLNEFRPSYHLSDRRSDLLRPCTSEHKIQHNDLEMEFSEIENLINFSSASFSTLSYFYSFILIIFLHFFFGGESDAWIWFLRSMCTCRWIQKFWRTRLLSSRLKCKFVLQMVDDIINKQYVVFVA